MREQLYACEPNYILNYLDRLENATEEEIKLAAQMFGETDEDPLKDIYEEDGDEALIRVEGPLSQDGPSPLARLFGFGGASYRSLIAACNKAAASACKSVTFAFDSPGGEVNGLDQAWQHIQALARSKPCTAENNCLMASAAYLLASACPRIVATSPACEQGSIGVKVVAVDDSDLLEKFGLKKVTIVSRNAPNKNDDASTKAGRSVIQDRADAMERQFLARVAEGRGLPIEKIISDFGQGAVLVARDPEGEEDALKAGMIDGIVAPRGLAQMVPDNASRRMPGMSGSLAAEVTLEAPYPNFHACRLAEPNGEKTRYAKNERDHKGKSYDVIYQKKKGSDSWEEQAYRYDKSKWTAEDAGKHCKAHGGKFEGAKNAKAENGRNRMTLNEILEQNPEARAEYDKALANAKAEGRSEQQAIAKKVGIYLTSEVYAKSKAIVERALKALSGEGTVEAVEASVSMFDLLAEQKKQEQAAAETAAAGETPAQKVEADALLLSKAASLKIDVERVKAAAKAQGLDPAKALAAEIELQEQLAKDKTAMGPAGMGV